MKLKKMALFGALCVSVISEAGAASILGTNLYGFDGGATDSIILDKNTQSPLVASGVAQLGAFNVSNAQVDTWVAAKDYTSLVSAWGTAGLYIGTSNFSSDANNFNGMTLPGCFVINVSGFNPAAITASTIYTFIGGSNTLAGSSAFALYREPNKVLADPLLPPEGNNYFYLTGGSLLIGTAGTRSLTIPDINPDSPHTFNTITLVPETSSVLLGALGALGLLRRRR